MNQTSRGTPPRVLLETLFAAEAPRAVVLRRGPKSHYQLIAWDLERDRFTPGQWMRGTVFLCDLSPDGTKLLYWASQYHRPTPRPDSGGFDPLAPPPQPPKRRRRRKLPRYLQGPGAPRGKRPAFAPRPVGQAWTAISRPPYFSALAIWPSDDSWTGGGVFLSDDAIALNEDAEGLVPQVKVPLERDFRVQSLREAGLTLAGSLPAPGSLRWRLFRKEIAARRPVVRSAFNPFSAEQEGRGEARAALEAAGAARIEWLDLRKAPDLTFACDGRIWRLRNWREVPAGKVFERADCLADFRDSTFEKLPPPASALRW